VREPGPALSGIIIALRCCGVSGPTTSLYWLGVVNQGTPPCSAYSSHRRFTILSSENWCARGDFGVACSLEAGVSAPLALSGTRTEPRAQALAAAREVAQAFASWRPAIELALLEHYEPYAEAVTAGELPSPSEALPRIAAPGDVWSHVSLVFVSVTPLSSLLTTELGYTTAWDDEHTLGARFQSGKFIELCGSVLPP
jgi:hypothetical protein